MSWGGVLGGHPMNANTTNGPGRVVLHTSTCACPACRPREQIIPTSTGIPLTPREAEVYGLRVGGVSTFEVASRIGASPSAVRSIVSRIRAKGLEVPYASKEYEERFAKRKAAA